MNKGNNPKQLQRDSIIIVAIGQKNLQINSPQKPRKKTYLQNLTDIQKSYLYGFLLFRPIIKVILCIYVILIFFYSFFIYRRKIAKTTTKDDQKN